MYKRSEQKLTVGWLYCGDINLECEVAVKQQAGGLL